MNLATSKRKPIEIHVFDKKKHMGSEEKNARADAELVMGQLKFTPPPEVKKNKIAMRKWREVTKIYKDAKLTVVSSTDSGVLGRYCLLNAEYEHLIQQRALICSLDFPEEIEEELLEATGEGFNKAQAGRLWKLMKYFTGLDGIIKIDKIINAKVKAILDIEDRIFLNPAAKVRTLPIQHKAKVKDPVGDMGFDV
jgi:hypothetical protein